MSQQLPADHISKKRVVYTLPRMDTVTIRREQQYRSTDSGQLTMDLYYPDSDRGTRRPAVIFVTGFSDTGAVKRLGCTFKDMGTYVSWAQLIAASGMVGVTYTNIDPTADVHALLEHVRQHAESLGIDENRIGLWSCSGHAPNALSVLMHKDKDYLKCAALCYPFTLDLDDSSLIADAARQFGFVTPAAGKSLADLPRNVPLFIARAGEDRMPGLNDALDRFVASALTANLPLTVANHATGPHAFDVFDDSAESRAIVRQILEFFRDRLERSHADLG